MSIKLKQENTPLNEYPKEILDGRVGTWFIFPEGKFLFDVSEQTTQVGVRGVSERRRRYPLEVKGFPKGTRKVESSILVILHKGIKKEGKEEKQERWEKNGLQTKWDYKKQNYELGNSVFSTMSTTAIVLFFSI